MSTLNKMILLLTFLALFIVFSITGRGQEVQIIDGPVKIFSLTSQLRVTTIDLDSVNFWGQFDLGREFMIYTSAPSLQSRLTALHGKKVRVTIELVK